ncbi:hypothetical protein [Aromatoleum evansii]|uniref:hypothetical protein n=1 Tax=Aromatoleum evansii TaxID=59406 RepID=UPI00145FC896|nr:hypothetical protein [Aromatoleum evansii]NMG32362.1 hypothetical protein [Aromatoleum evansii]
MNVNRDARLKKLERTHLTQPGSLPCAVVLPPDISAAERAVILANVAKREAAGQRVLVVSSAAEALDALVDAFAP